MILVARGSRAPREMWVPLENKVSLDHRVPKASGATQAWQDPRERWVLVDIKAWWAPLGLLGHRVKRAQGGHQAERVRRGMWGAKVPEDPRG